MIDKLEIIEKVFNIFTGLLSLIIAYKVFIVGQQQFDANISLTKQQLDLSISSGEPILAITTCGFTPNLISGEYEFVFKVQNFGERPANNTEIKMIILAESEQKKYLIIDTFKDQSSNSIVKNVQIDLNYGFKTKEKSKKIILIEFKYGDEITGKIKTNKYCYFMPENHILIDRKERGFMNSSAKEKNQIEEFLKNEM